MLILILLLIIIIIFIYQLFLIPWIPALPPKLSNSIFFYYGHRGVPTLAEENTLASFQAAIDKKMDGLELDIQMSNDRHMIVYHDEHVNYQNNPKTSIQSLTLDEINTITIKSHPIPTLEQVVNILPDNMILNIEIKSYGLSSFGIEKKLINLIHQRAIESQIIISSFNPFVIKKIKNIDKKISTAFIWCAESYYSYRLFTNYSKPDAFHVDINDMNQDMVKWCNKKNINIYAYTVNSKEELQKAQQYNVNGIFTDNPEVKSV